MFDIETALRSESFSLKVHIVLSVLSYCSNTLLSISINTNRSDFDAKRQHFTY